MFIGGLFKVLFKVSLEFHFGCHRNVYRIFCPDFQRPCGSPYCFFTVTFSVSSKDSLWSHVGFHLKFVEGSMYKFLIRISKRSCGFLCDFLSLDFGFHFKFLQDFV